MSHTIIKIKKGWIMKKLLSVILMIATICAASCSNNISNAPETSEPLASVTTNTGEAPATDDMEGESDAEKYMSYTLNDDGKSYSVCPVGLPDVIKELVFPGEYNGLPITEVHGGESAEVSIETIIISEGVKEVSGFSECFDIKNIYIPASVIHINEGTFNSRPTMGGIPSFVKSNVIEKIVVAEGNPYYHVDGNCLIETKSKKIILGCNSSVIPDDGSVKSIGYAAFANCKSIETIVLPKSIIELEYAAFYNCPNLKKVYITSSVSKDKRVVNFDPETVFGFDSERIYYVSDAESLEIYSKLFGTYINLEIEIL